MTEIPGIRMVDLHHQYMQIKEEIDDAIQNVLNHTQFINGPEVGVFAQKLAEYHSVPMAVTCGNCTDALQIALMTLDLQPGDEIILPAFTYVATAEVIALLQLTPVFVDVDYNSFNIDINKLERSISSKTKAIIPVHLYGQCAEMEPLQELGLKYKLSIVEDAAQAIGSEYTFSNDIKKKAGTIGDMGCISFFPSKNLGCYGDGGAILSNNHELTKKAKRIANHGQSKKYIHELIGCNSRLDTLQASILNVKIKYLDRFTTQRQEVARKYDEALKDVPDIVIPFKSPRSTHVYNQYTLKVTGINRDRLQEKLREKGVPAMIYYPIPLHLQKAYKSRYLQKDRLNISEQLSREVLSLPIHTEMSSNNQDYIIEMVIKSISELK